MFVCLCS
jgi:cold-inducible RNA-binding protein